MPEIIIKQRLQELQLTIKDFAAMLGIAYSTLRALLVGQNKFTEQLKRHAFLLLDKIEQERRNNCSVAFELPPFLLKCIQEEATKKNIPPSEFYALLIKELALKVAEALTARKLSK